MSSQEVIDGRPTADNRELFAIAAAAISPRRKISVSDWAAKYRRIPEEASPHPGRWLHEWAPYAVEIMDCLAPDHPCRKVALKKSAQVAGTEIATNWLGFIIDIAPGPTLYVHPTIELASGWVTEKLNPTIEVTPQLRRKVRAQSSRSEQGSTQKFKKFPGGFIVVTGANSAAGLRSRSIKYLIKDDYDGWPLDVGKEGDPGKLADARQKAFEQSGQAKTFVISTPTIKNISRIDREYAASDQREWHMPCPHCGHEQAFWFDHLQWDPGKPETVVYVCVANGCVIEPHEKAAMVRAGHWVAKRPGEGRQPGFFLNALVSLFEPWSAIVTRYEEAEEDPQLLQPFTNIDLGESFDAKGNAPKWEDLRDRRDDYEMGIVPDGAVFLTAAVDVQGTGFWYEVVGWGPRRRSWSVDYGFISGETTAEADTWEQVAALLERKYPTAAGGEIGIEMLGIDSGFRADAVYEFCRRHPRARALKGADGWGLPAIKQGSKPETVRHGRRAGQKKKRSVLLWHVGTWDLKSQFYSALDKKTASDSPADPSPPEWCGFSKNHEDSYFQQITAESRVDQIRGGRPTTYWIVSGDNHLFDCRVYNMAIADLRGLWKLTDAEWEAARARLLPEPNQQASLIPVFEGREDAPARAPAHAPAEGTKATQRPPPGNWVGERKGWLDP